MKLDDICNFSVWVDLCSDIGLEIFRISNRWRNFCNLEFKCLCKIVFFYCVLVVKGMLFKLSWY